MSLSEHVREWLLAPVLAAVKELKVAGQTQEQALQASITRVEGQVGEAVAELRRLADALAARPEVDLTQETAALNALADRLDAAVVPAPAPPPAPPPPAPGA